MSSSLHYSIETITLSLTDTQTRSQIYIKLSSSTIALTSLALANQHLFTDTHITPYSVASHIVSKPAAVRLEETTPSKISPIATFEVAAHPGAS